MDDKLVWTDTVSAFALHGVRVPQVLRRMWGHLRKAVLYFMRYQPNQHALQHLEEAQNELLRYGRLVESTWHLHELATFNLHTCVVHVPEQARLCGATGFAAEWWVERLMQVFKRTTKYRCTRYPETSAVQHWLMVAALEDERMRHPGISKHVDAIRCGRSTGQDKHWQVPMLTTVAAAAGAEAGAGAPTPLDLAVAAAPRVGPICGSSPQGLAGFDHASPSPSLPELATVLSAAAPLLGQPEWDGQPVLAPAVTGTMEEPPEVSRPTQAKRGRTGPCETQRPTRRKGRRVCLSKVNGSGACY
jgi:hypothetical protein